MAAAGRTSARSSSSGATDVEALKDSASPWINSVDRLLDANPSFVSALRATFIRFQDPKSATIAPDSLLPALQYLFQRATEELDPRTNKLFFRPVTSEDLDILAEQNPDLDIGEPADVETFGVIARKLLNYILINRGKRLGFFVAGGIVTVHVIKGIAQRVPFLGPAAGTVLRFFPTLLVGPIVGVVGAMCS